MEHVVLTVLVSHIEKEIHLLEKAVGNLQRS